LRSGAARRMQRSGDAVAGSSPVPPGVAACATFERQVG
jgi:hypothetical protein